jgi:hypothetical protein
VDATTTNTPIVLFPVVAPIMLKQIQNPPNVASFSTIKVPFRQRRHRRNGRAGNSR